MKRIQVLDCTLRDGGYCNNWQFGYQNMQRITQGLTEANIDIVECGFLTHKTQCDKEISKFNTIEEIRDIIPIDRTNKLYVAMINYGEYCIEDLPNNDYSSVDGIRLAFHKKDWYAALEMCREIQKKGYLVFVQPMVSMSYTDEEFIKLIRNVAEFHPYAFYIVDSFGSMQQKTLTRLFCLVEHNMYEDIRIGFHSHNNMQLAFSNAQTLVSLHSSHKLIIDSSIYGMGRGAGNLNTELFVEYLNAYTGADYRIKPLLQIIDEILNDFYKRNYWGYSLPNYISAKFDTHPNYAGYLADKNTLTVENMNEIFEIMDSEKRVEFDKNYIEQLYIRYMQRERIQSSQLETLKNTLKGKRVLLIAPGKSSIEEKEKIVAFASQNDVLSVSVNHSYPHFHTDYKFISNIRRFKDIDKSALENCIITSNIMVNLSVVKVEYSSLLNSIEAVKDNAGLMCIRLFIDLGVQEIWLAGFDGYTHDVRLNYAEKSMEIITQEAVLDAMNSGIISVLQQYQKEANIRFLTSPKKIIMK
ncbi:MAG: aldolase catalytic domain-containing protein [Ruminococcus sp.]|nr:aldolase catalytic domain-containing protein [Ruminococcus sp.]